jgi:hypothetical protein
METGSRQLVGECLDRHDGVGLGFLALVETLGLGTKAPCKIRRFDKSPGQVLVAAPGVAFAFLLAIADTPAIDATRLGGKVADRRQRGHKGPLFCWEGKIRTADR